MITWDPSPHAEQNTIARFILNQCKEEPLTDIINEAKEELRYISSEPVFDGYVSGSKTKVFEQVEAIYLALSKHEPHISWTIEPKDRFVGVMRQEVRSVWEIFRQRGADCVDIVAVFAALLIKIGLNPCLVVTGPAERNRPTHAILGYWIESRTFPATKVQWTNAKPLIGSLAFLEATGVLQENHRIFDDASADALQSLPRDSRELIPLPSSAKERVSISPLAQSDMKVHYLVDLRSALQELSSIKPVLAIMGVRGQVGKTSITTRMAELIAETKTNVLIVDFDIDSAGSTLFHVKRLHVGLPAFMTVYDHLVPYSSSEDKNGKRHAQVSDQRLWRVTPEYLEQKRLGEIYLIPARPLNAGELYRVVADIEPKKRNAVLRAEVDNILQRAELAEQDIGCVIIDCGAGLNPIYFAAVERANRDGGSHALIITTPDVNCFHNFEGIRREYRDNYPYANTSNLQLIVNRITDNNDKTVWVVYHPIEYIEEDDAFRKAYYKGAVDFDLGYDDFTLSVRRILEKTLKGADASMVPNEIDIWIAPWMKQIVDYRLPQATLESKHFRTWRVLAYLLPIIGLLFSLMFGYLNNRSETTRMWRYVYALGLLFSLTFGAYFAIFTEWNFWRIQQRRRLLLEVAKRGTDKEFLKGLLRSPEKGPLKWLKRLWKEALEKEREEERSRRMLLRTPSTR